MNTCIHSASHGTVNSVNTRSAYLPLCISHPHPSAALAPSRLAARRPRSLGLAGARHRVGRELGQRNRLACLPPSARRTARKRCSCRAQGPLTQARGPSAPKEISISRGLGPGPATSEVSMNSRKTRNSRKTMSLPTLGELRQLRARKVARSW